MLQVKINNKIDLMKAINAISVKKVCASEVHDQKDVAIFIADIKTLITTSGTLTLIAIKE